MNKNKSKYAIRRRERIKDMHLGSPKEATQNVFIGFIFGILTFIGQFIYGAVSYLITCLLYPGITKDPDDK